MSLLYVDPSFRAHRSLCSYSSMHLLAPCHWKMSKDISFKSLTIARRGKMGLLNLIDHDARLLQRPQVALQHRPDGDLTEPPLALQGLELAPGLCL